MTDLSSLQGAAARAILNDKLDLLTYLLNDHGNAQRLIAISGQDLKYCHAMKKWLVWDGMRWAVDDTDQARKLAKEALLEFFRQAGDSKNEAAEKFARASLDARRITNMLSMDECEIFVRPSELDTDPYLLNFLNGTVDRKPMIRDADDKATFDRLHPIPFTVRVRKDRIDRDLPAKLLLEAEGILAWAVAGAKLWHESGLEKPAEVEAAKDRWHAEADQLGRFVAECCVLRKNLEVSATRLYSAYKQWAEEAQREGFDDIHSFWFENASPGIRKERSEHWHRVRRNRTAGVRTRPQRIKW